MADGKFGSTERTSGTSQQLILERTFLHVVNKEERTRAELDALLVNVAVAAMMLMVGLDDGRKNSQRQQGAQRNLVNTH
jgi:hypothetical protein